MLHSSFITPPWRLSIQCSMLVNTLRLTQNGRHFPDDIFKCIFLNENVWILIKISLKFVPNGPIVNIPALVQIMAWRRPGGKPLSEPMMVRLLTHTCVTRPQLVNAQEEIPTNRILHMNCNIYTTYHPIPSPGQNGWHFGIRQFQMHFLEWKW